MLVGIYMVTKEEKREDVVERITQIRKIGAELHVELNKRGIEDLSTTVTNEVEYMCESAIRDYLEG